MCDIMYGSAKFKSVPIIDVTKENIAEVAPVIRGAIIGADFIAIDCVRQLQLKKNQPFIIKSTYFRN